MHYLVLVGLHPDEINDAQASLTNVFGTFYDQQLLITLNEEGIEKFLPMLGSQDKVTIAIAEQETHKILQMHLATLTTLRTSKTPAMAYIASKTSTKDARVTQYIQGGLK